MSSSKYRPAFSHSLCLHSPVSKQNQRIVAMQIFMDAGLQNSVMCDMVGQAHGEGDGFLQL